MTSIDDHEIEGVAGVPVGPGRDAEARPADVAEGERPLTSADYSVAFSPRNVAIGLAIVAGLVALVASRRRRDDRPAEDEG